MLSNDYVCYSLPNFHQSLNAARIYVTALNFKCGHTIIHKPANHVDPVDRHLSTLINVRMLYFTRTRRCEDAVMGNMIKNYIRYLQRWRNTKGRLIIQLKALNYSPASCNKSTNQLLSVYNNILSH